MTDKEKARAYDEALERARKSLRAASDIGTDIVTFIFPQLAESEDERIREALVRLVSTVGEYYLKLDCRNKMLAYLEKQKEQTEELVYRLNGLMQEFINESKDEAEQEHRFKCYKLFWDAIEDTSYFDEQKEQKPAEWSEKDNIGWDEAFACVTKAEKAAKNEEELQNAVTAEKWLKEIKFKYCIHPVKSEWSEKDEEFKERLMDCMCAAQQYAIGSISWEVVEMWAEELSELCPQPKQEWSEEDEHRRTDAIYFLETAKTHYADTSELDATISWLKSFRPSWKPNDEDEVRLINTTISFLDDFKKKGYENAVECIDWLKSKLNGNSDK